MISKAMTAIGLAAGLLMVGAQVTLAQLPPNPQTGPVRVSAVDAKFMVQAGQSDMSEIRAGQLALEKSQSESVRKYAQEMIDEKTALSDELGSLADAENITLAGNLDPKQQALYDKLSNLSGEEFDKAYLQGQQVAHSDTLLIYRRYINSGKDDQTKLFARKTLQTRLGSLVQRGQGVIEQP